MKGHKKEHKAYGGVVEKDEPSKDVYAGGSSPTSKEADEKKHGGRVKRKHGGKVMEAKHIGKIDGGKARLRLDRPGRKSGGRVGSDSAPMSSAAKTSDAPGRSASECG